MILRDNREVTAETKDNCLVIRGLDAILLGDMDVETDTEDDVFLVVNVRILDILRFAIGGEFDRKLYCNKNVLKKCVENNNKTCVLCQMWRYVMEKLMTLASFALHPCLHQKMVQIMTDETRR